MLSSIPLKTLKFAPNLVPLVLSGEKTTTWRLFDDKDLSVGDALLLLEAGTLRHFAEVMVESVEEKPLGQLTEQDWLGHERFSNETEMYRIYEGYYHQPVGPESMVKMIRFSLTKVL